MARQALLKAHHSQGAGWQREAPEGHSSLIKVSQGLTGTWKRRKATFCPIGPSSARSQE